MKVYLVKNKLINRQKVIAEDIFDALNKYKKHVINLNSYKENGILNNIIEITYIEDFDYIE